MRRFLAGRGMAAIGAIGMSEFLLLGWPLPWGLQVAAAAGLFCLSLTLVLDRLAFGPPRRRLATVTRPAACAARKGPA